MSLADKFTAAGYELIAPEKDVLLNDGKNLDDEINNISPIQSTITKLRKEFD